METTKKNWKIRLGIILVIVCIPFFLAIPIIPFTEMENSLKISISTGLLICGEVLFWSGGLLLGKELFAKYKNYLDPRTWFSKSKVK